MDCRVSGFIAGGWPAPGKRLFGRSNGGFPAMPHVAQRKEAIPQKPSLFGSGPTEYPGFFSHREHPVGFSPS